MVRNYGYVTIMTRVTLVLTENLIESYALVWSLKPVFVIRFRNIFLKVFLDMKWPNVFEVFWLFR